MTAQMPPEPEGFEAVPVDYAPHAMMQWFAYDHLRDMRLRELSANVADLAQGIDVHIGNSAEKTAGLRKLLEAKDCFVRAAILDIAKEQEAMMAQGPEEAAIARAQAMIAAGTRICEYCLTGDHANCIHKMIIGTPHDDQYYAGPCMCANGCGQR